MASRSETAKLLASLELKDKFTPTIRNADKALGKFDANLDKTSSRSYRAGQQIGTGIKNAGKLAAVGIGIVTANLALGLDSLIKVEKQTAQTEAVLKSTGGAAGLTAKDIRGLAEEYEALNATIGDEVIQEGANLLLGFTNIRKKAFEPTIAAALDMNTRLGKGPEGLTATIKTLGVALNDPTKGLGRLSKAGVTFSQEQTKRIKKLQEEGDLYGAQTVILDELNKRFGGAFAAEGETTAGTVAKFTDAIEDTQRALAEGALPAVRNVADALTELVQDPEIQQGVRDLGDSIGKALSKENVKEGARIIGDVVKAVAAAAPTIAAGLSTAANVIGAVVSAFQKLPPEVQQLAVGAFAVNKLTGGLLTNVAGGIFGALKTMTVQAGVVNVTGATAGSVGGLGKGAAAAGVGLGTIVLGAGALAGISQAIADAANEVFKTPANQPKFQAPQLFNPIPALNNILEVLKVNQNRPAPVKTPEQNKALAEANRKLAAQALEIQRQGERGGRALDAAKAAISQRVQETTRETTRGAMNVQASQRTAAAIIAAQQAASAGAIIAAIFAARPIISVQNVTRTYNRTTNYGPTSGSKNANSADSNYGPN